MLFCTLAISFLDFQPLNLYKYMNPARKRIVPFFTFTFVLASKRKFISFSCVFFSTISFLLTFDCVTHSHYYLLDGEISFIWPHLENHGQENRDKVWWEKNSTNDEHQSYQFGFLGKQNVTRSVKSTLLVKYNVSYRNLNYMISFC